MKAKKKLCLPTQLFCQFTMVGYDWVQRLPDFTAAALGLADL